MKGQTIIPSLSLLRSLASGNWKKLTVSLLYLLYWSQLRVRIKWGRQLRYHRRGEVKLVDRREFLLSSLLYITSPSLWLYCYVFSISRDQLDITAANIWMKTWRGQLPIDPLNDWYLLSDRKRKQREIISKPAADWLRGPPGLAGPPGRDGRDAVNIPMINQLIEKRFGESVNVGFINILLCVLYVLYYTSAM